MKRFYGKLCRVCKAKSFPSPGVTCSLPKPCLWYVDASCGVRPFVSLLLVARTYLQTQAIIRPRPCDLLRACAVTRYYLASPRSVMCVVEQRGTLGACFLVARVYVVAFPFFFFFSSTFLFLLQFMHPPQPRRQRPSECPSSRPGSWGFSALFFLYPTSPVREQCAADTFFLSFLFLFFFSFWAVSLLSAVEGIVEDSFSDFTCFQHFFFFIFHCLSCN